MYNEYMIRKNTIKKDDLEVRLFMETPIWYYPILTPTFHSISLHFTPFQAANRLGQAPPSQSQAGGPRNSCDTRENAVKMG